MDDEKSEIGIAWYVATSFEWAVELRGQASTEGLVNSILAVADTTFGSALATHAYYRLNNVLVLVFLNENAAKHWSSSLDGVIKTFLEDPDQPTFPFKLTLP